MIFRSHAKKVSIPEIFRKVEGVTHEMFQYWEAKKTNGKSRCPLLSIEVFDVLKILKQRGFPQRTLWAVYVKKNSTEKSDITLLGMKFFDSRTFRIYRSVLQRNASALWAKKLSTESSDILFFLIKFFDTSYLKLSEKLDGSSRSFLVLWDKKNRREVMILQKIFEIPNHLRLRSGYHELFWYCETKKFRQKNVIFRSHALKVSMPEISREVEGVTHETFQFWEAKKTNGISRCPRT